MRPFPLLNATKVLLLALVLGFGVTDYSAARDLDQRTIYRRGHHDRHESHMGLSGASRYRHGNYWSNNGWRSDRWRGDHWRNADRRFDRRLDRRERHHDYARDYRRYRNRVPSYDYNDTGFPGTYTGGISAWRDPGNGIYFEQDNYGGYGYGDVNIDVDLGAYMNRPRVLDVDPEAMDRACAYERGVCVIRRR